MSELVSAFRQHLEVHRSARTVRTYGAIAAAAIDVFAIRGCETVPQSADVEAFLSRPARHTSVRAASTRNQELAALRALAAFAVERGHWRSNPTIGIPFAREAPRDPAVLSASELRRFFVVAARERQPHRRARSLAILALLSQAGLRVHEVVALNVDQIDVASATLVAVRGKGGTIHDVPLNGPTLSLIASWLSERARIVAACSGPLFVSRGSSRLSIRSVQRLLASLRTAVGTAKHVTPHTLRHTTATLALSLGSDLSTVGDLLRHSDLNTTRRYLHLVDERRREAVRRLAVTVPAEIVVAVVDSEQSVTVGACTQRSSKYAQKSDTDVDAQYGLDDVAEAA